MLLFGTRKQQAKIDRSAVIHIGGSAINVSDSARNLGVQLGSTLSFDEHVNNVCHNCYLHIKRLARIRQYLTIHSATVLGAAIVSSKFDYCNSLLGGTIAANIGRLQPAQDCLVRAIYRLPRKVQTTPYLSQLHWLPIKERINFKLALLSWKALSLKQAMYLSELLTRLRDSCSRDHGSFDSKCVTTRTGERAFGICVPRLWNTLLDTITSSSTLSLFKTRLKTFPFIKAFLAD